MFNQLKLELYKFLTFPMQYIAMAIMFVIGVVYGYLIFGAVDNTSEVFASVVCDTSFVFIYASISAWFISGDFGNRTITNELKSGCSRLSVIVTRTIMVSLSIIVLHLMYIVSTVIGFSIVHGFDASIFSTKNLLWLITVLLQLMATDCLVVMLCFAMKKATSGIVVSVITIVVLCNILRNFMMNTKIFTFSCFCLAQNSGTQLLLTSGLFAVICALVFFFMAFLLFRKADIK